MVYFLGFCSDYLYSKEKLHNDQIHKEGSIL